MLSSSKARKARIKRRWKIDYLEPSNIWSRENITSRCPTETPVETGIGITSCWKMMLVDRRIAAALDAQKKEFRIAELESKVKEYEEELEERESPLQSAIGRVAPYLPAILERFFGRPGMQVGVAGTSQPIRVPAPDPNTDDNSRILRIAERLAAIEPDYLNLLEKLCDKLEENPALLGMIKQFA